MYANIFNYLLNNCICHAGISAIVVGPVDRWLPNRVKTIAESSDGNFLHYLWFVIYRKITSLQYSNFVQIPKLRTDNSRIALRVIRIPILTDIIGIPKTRRAILELSRFQ